jgi:hypothetical protein
MSLDFTITIPENVQFSTDIKPQTNLNLPTSSSVPLSPIEEPFPQLKVKQESLTSQIFKRVVDGYLSLISWDENAGLARKAVGYVIGFPVLIVIGLEKIGLIKFHYDPDFEVQDKSEQQG